MFGRVKTADKFKIGDFQGVVQLRAAGTVDQNAIFLLNSGAEGDFCRCRHIPEGKSQLFAYQVQGLTALSYVTVTQREARLLLQTLWRFLTSVRMGTLCVENLAVQPENIYYNGSRFFLIYAPLVFTAKQNAKGNVSAVITRLLGGVRDGSGMIPAFLAQSKRSGDITEALGAFLSSLPPEQPVEDRRPVSSPQPSERFDRPPTEADRAEYETTVLTGELSEDNEGETTVLGAFPDDDGETTVLGSAYSDAEGETTVLGGMIIESEEDAASVFSGVPQSDNDDDTTLLSAALTESDETSVLGQQVTGGSQRLAAVPSAPQTLKVTLIRTCNGQEIDLPPYCDIGSEAGTGTIAIPNPGISRRHATIMTEGDAVFIIDNHSTNGTVADGITLRPNEKAEIFDGSFLTLGDESLQVRIR